MKTIKSIKIHPAIGLGRLGNGPTGFFVGPERPGEHPRSQVELLVGKQSGLNRSPPTSKGETIMTKPKLATRKGKQVSIAALGYVYA